jgi:signal transduction histidine kinase
MDDFNGPQTVSSGGPPTKIDASVVALASRFSRRTLRVGTADVARYAAGIAALTGAYYLAAQVGYELQFTGSVTAIWPPVGVAVAVLYLGGLRWWPGIVAGDLLSAESLSPLHTAIAVTAANVAEALVATLLLRRLIGRRTELDRLEQVGAMLVAIAPATAISATVGSIMLLIDGVIHSGQVSTVWRTIWLGDSAGALVVLPFIILWAPAILAFARNGARVWPWRRVLEGGVLLALLLGIGAIVFASPRPLSYLVFPVLIWAALRFGQRGATLAVFCAAGIAVWRTSENAGPFVEHSITQTTLSTQLYLAVSALTTLCLGAIVSERQRSASDLADSRRREAERAAEERQRIARDLHDSVSQSLFSMTLHTRTAERALRRTGQQAQALVERELVRLGELSHSALTEMRALIFELRPHGLTEEGLVAAFTKHAGAVSVREALPITVRGPSERLPISPECEEHLYRLGQEALANVVKHAQAERVTLAVTNDAGTVGLEVHDDGRGFDPSSVYPGHFGLTTMRSRANEIGARLDIDSTPGSGTLVRVALPISDGQARRRSDRDD